MNLESEYKTTHNLESYYKTTHNPPRKYEDMIRSQQTTQTKKTIGKGINSAFS